MTELETHLVNAFKQLDAHYQQRDQQLASVLLDLTKRLKDGAGRQAILTAQLNALAERVERLQAALKQR